MAQGPPQKKFKQTATAKLARERLSRMLEKLDHDEGRWWRVQELVPEAWATLEEDIWCEEPKVRLTLMLDTSVAKFYRAMGKGYQARMNRILATYAQMKIGEVEREARAMRAIVDEPFPRDGGRDPREMGGVARPGAGRVGGGQGVHGAVVRGVRAYLGVSPWVDPVWNLQVPIGGLRDGADAGCEETPARNQGRQPAAPSPDRPAVWRFVSVSA